MKLIPIGQLLDKSWELYTQHFARFMKITTWLFLGSIFYLVSLALSPRGNELGFLATQGLLSIPQMVGLALSILGMGLIFGLIRLWAQMELIQTVDVIQSKAPTTASDIHKRTWNLSLPFLGLSLFRGLLWTVPLLVLVPFYFFGVLSLTAENFALWGALSLLSAFFGSIGGLILLIVLVLWFWFAGFALLLEGKTIIAALRHAHELIRGRFFATLWRLIIPKILFKSVIIIAHIILFQLFTILLTNIPGLSDSLYSTVALIIGNLVFVGSFVLTLPLFISADYLLYDSLRKNQ